MSQDSVQIRFGSPEELRREFEKNISNRGIFIATECEFEVRTAINVDVFLDYTEDAMDRATPILSTEIAITLRGEVVHWIPASMAATGATPGVAIQFDDSARELCESFAPLLERQAAEVAAIDPSVHEEASHRPRDDAAEMGEPSRISELPIANESAAKFGRERREARREAVRVPVRIMPTMSPPFEATSRDLSASGILLTLRNVELPMGEIVRTCLWHPSGDPSIEIDGQVVREIKNKKGHIAAVAIAFDRHQAADPQTRELIDAIRQAGHRSRLGGISGSIVDLGLANMLQMFGSSAPAGTLVVERDGEQGWIAFAESQFLGAELGALKDLDALIAMLDWGEGRFHFEATVDAKIVASMPPKPLEALVFEAVCALDERSRPDADATPEEMIAVTDSTTFLVDLEQEESLRSSLEKTDEAVLELVKSGMSAGKLKEIIPEAPAVVQAALEGLIERGILVPC